MKSVRFYLSLVAVFLALVVPGWVMAAPSMTPLPTAAKASPALPIAEQLSQQLQNLVQPVPAASSTPTVPSQAAASAATTSADDDNAPEATPTFGTRALNAVINITEILRGETEKFVTDFAATPQFSDWFAQQKNDPRYSSRWVAVGNDLLTATGLALLGALALELLLYPLRMTLRKKTPRHIGVRIATVLSLFALRALPILLFILLSIMLLDQYETQKLPRFIVMNAVYALALARITVSFLRGVLSPQVEALRFVPATNAQATYGYRWLRAFAILIICGYFCDEVARVVHIPESVIAAFTNTLGLVLVIMSILVIVQKRAFVAHLLRGNLSAAQQDLSWFDALRLWFARHWHRLAIAYLVIGYLVAALGIQNGLQLMLRGTLLTLLALVGARILLREIGLWESRSRSASTAIYAILKGLLLRFVVFFVAATIIIVSWGVDVVALASSPLGRRLLGSAFSIGVTFTILGVIYEFFSSAIDRHLAQDASNGTVLVSARSRTLLPMIRNVILVIFLAVIGVMVLSEAGVNIGPLLAGAGVLGVAVGFGSQALVKDFLTGLFIVLENAVTVGDVIKVGDHSGVVEAMSMRTFRLRDMDGSLHIMPFSEASQIINYTRGFAHAVIKFSVAQNADLNRVIDCVKQAGEILQKDPAMKRLTDGEVEILGVDSINDASVTVMARVRTQAGGQWDVKRKFLLILMQLMIKENIPMSNATTVILQNNAG
jgi:small conductance mechanosensitive channel